MATDTSRGQLAHAARGPRVWYVAARAETPPLARASVDLVTVAQALHWFDVDTFYQAARNVLAPGGAIAAWCYGLAEINPAVDAVVRRFYSDVVGPYWAPQRRHVESGYATLPFPFRAARLPAFTIEADLTLDEFAGYVGTWSATAEYRAARGDPVVQLREELASHWGTPGERRTVRWPLSVRAGFRD